jgi:competence protein ComEC
MRNLWGRMWRIRKAVLIASLLLAALMPGITNRFSLEREGDGTTLKVTFFDVGQGDSIFIESPTGTQVLIDGGPDGTVLRRLANQMGYWDRTLDMVVATHEDKDHVGGLPDVFNNYRVGTFLRTENQGESAEAHIIDQLSLREGSEIINARRGTEYDLGASTTLTVLFPDTDPSMLDSNTSSIVLKLVYGTTTFLFTGDSPQNIEGHLAFMDPDGIKSTVLKLGHHGSKTSTSEYFLSKVRPEYAIVSAGKCNRYGHPHKEVVERLNARDIQIFNTADVGTVTFTSDGVRLNVSHAQ